MDETRKNASPEPKAWLAVTGTAGRTEGCDRPFWLRQDAVDYVGEHGGWIMPLYGHPFQANEAIDQLERDMRTYVFDPAPERRIAMLDRYRERRGFGSWATTQSERLTKAIAEANAAVAAMSDEDRAAMWQAQRESWVRGMAPCPHGIADFEECADCRAGE